MNEKIFKADAVVLLTTNFGDSNKVVTFFTKEYGKIEANAYGCRRIKNHLSGAMQMFNHISLQFVKTHPYKVHDAEIIDFHNIDEDLNKITYSSIFFEIVNKMTPFEQVDNDVFILLLNFIRSIDKRNPRIASLIASIQFVNKSGFAVESSESILNFDWNDETKLTFKSSEIETTEKYFYAYVQSLINAPLNSLKFLDMINSLS